MILTIRTDKPEAEVGLFDQEKKLSYETWQAHRQLSETIHTKIQELLKEQKADWSDITGIVCFTGPGSFTGLRIGITVGNALALGLNIPVVGSNGEDWIRDGVARLEKNENDKSVIPEYGRDPHITQQKK